MESDDGEYFMKYKDNLRLLENELYQLSNCNANIFIWRLVIKHSLCLSIEQQQEELYALVELDKVDVNICELIDQLLKILLETELCAWNACIGLKSRGRKEDPNQFSISHRGSKIPESGLMTSSLNSKMCIQTCEENSFHSTTTVSVQVLQNPLSHKTTFSGTMPLQPLVICHTTVTALKEIPFCCCPLLNADGKTSLQVLPAPSFTDTTVGYHYSSSYSGCNSTNAQTGLFNTPPATPPDLNQDFSRFQLLVDVTLKRAAKMELQSKPVA
ncbi:homeobox protein TGIF1-like [Protopterus annectens]|uniref:homeobox protein TGIF1-like n=1 Tax=Protopterus annectens TaxID=7888 RepID=UPI001CFBD521|nr:homeobox protein TGIF1-like [Protopterus annectens]